MTEGSSTDRGGNGPAPEAEAPRLQDTVERESVRLPLPDEPAGSPPNAEQAASAGDGPEDWRAPGAAGEPESTPASEPGPAPDWAGEGGETDDGPNPELLVGAAFAGGLVLALLLRRLRS